MNLPLHRSSPFMSPSTLIVLSKLRPSAAYPSGDPGSMLQQSAAPTCSEVGG